MTNVCHLPFLPASLQGVISHRCDPLPPQGVVPTLRDPLPSQGVVQYKVPIHLYY